jgi:hypothetical protein
MECMWQGPSHGNAGGSLQHDSGVQKGNVPAMKHVRTDIQTRIISPFEPMQVISKPGTRRHQQRLLEQKTDVNGCMKQ